MKKYKLIVAIFGALLVFMACGKKKLPEVKTNEVSNITENSVTCGGNVVDDGGGFIVGRGVCWSTSSEPTINDSYTFDGNGIGTFKSDIHNLESNTTYYVRAYATNENGTAYGELRTFKTNPDSQDTTINSQDTTTLNDFLGTYDVKAYNWDSKKFEIWSGTTIEINSNNIFGENTIAIYGIMNGAGNNFFTALGKYDDVNNCIRLFSNWGSGLFYFITDPDVSYRAYFYPVYASNNETTFNYIITGGSDGTDECGEAWIKKNSDGTLSLGASNTADNYGRYANGFCMRYEYYPSGEYADRFSAYNQVTFTKTSDDTKNSLYIDNETSRNIETLKMNELRRENTINNTINTIYSCPK